jgi:hypothetical protein
MARKSFCFDSSKSLVQVIASSLSTICKWTPQWTTFTQIKMPDRASIMNPIRTGLVSSPYQCFGWHRFVTGCTAVTNPDRGCPAGYYKKVIPGCAEKEEPAKHAYSVRKEEEEEGPAFPRPYQYHHESEEEEEEEFR